jgi:hypothetical protein
MNRLLLVGAVVVLSSCTTPTQPQPAKMPPPRRPAEVLHTLVLASPAGQGAIALTREYGVQGGETASYRASGSIVATDEVGQWRFAYTKTSLEGVGPTPGEWIVGLHAVSVVVVNTSPGPVEVDWENSAFVGPDGRSQRIVHRGVQLNQKAAPMLPSTIAAGATMNEFVFPSGGIIYSAPGRASVWNSPAVLERLAPGAGFSIVLNIKLGANTVAKRTFTFSAVAPPPAGRPQ